MVETEIIATTDSRFRGKDDSGASLTMRLPQLIIIAALLLGIAPLLMLLKQAGSTLYFDSTILDILAFTLKQAALSTLLSVIPGIFVARALSRVNFAGRHMLLALFVLPMAMPAIVAVLGVTALIGNAGPLPGLISPYGLSGILLVHVFFNLPMAARLFYQALQTAPPEGYRLAAQLGFSEFATFKYVEWPVLKAVMAQVTSIIFLLCAASFVVVLTLGGASATTLEVAIYQSLRMDFDPPRALALSLLQVGLCTALIGSAQATFTQDQGFTTLHHAQNRYIGQSQAGFMINAAIITLSAMLVLPVLGIIVWRGMANLHFTAITFQALLTSLGLGFVSAIITFMMGWPLAKAPDTPSQLLSLAGLIMPPAVLAAGWFLVLHKLGDSILLTSIFIVSLNSLMALPYTVAALRTGQQHLAPLRSLQSQLGLAGWTAFQIIEWPLLRHAATQAFLMALVLSLGDLTAITLLGSGGIITLPTLLHTEMGHYRGAQAEGTALLLLLVCGGLTYFAQHVGTRDD